MMVDLSVSSGFNSPPKKKMQSFVYKDGSVFKNFDKSVTFTKHMIIISGVNLDFAKYHVNKHLMDTLSL